MLNSLITSQTRIKLLKKFFLNSTTKSHLRGLESEFGESSNAIRVELNRFENAGLLYSFKEGNKKIYQANIRHPFFKEIHSIILKEIGIDQILEKIANNLGNLLRIYLIGDSANRKDNSIIELIVVGKGIDNEFFQRKVLQAEEKISRKIDYTILDSDSAERTLALYNSSDLIELWNFEEK